MDIRAGDWITGRDTYEGIRFEGEVLDLAPGGRELLVDDELSATAHWVEVNEVEAVESSPLALTV